MSAVWLLLKKHILRSLALTVACGLGLAFRIAEARPDTLVHTMVTDTRPVDPLRVFSMRMPFRIAPITSNYELSVDYHLGNTWNPSGMIEYPDASEPTPANAWEADYHPPYRDNPRRYQFYSADGVIRSTTIFFAHKSSKWSEVYTTINANMLIGTPRFLDKIVSDETIEFLHHTLFDQDDPFRRYQQGLDRAEMKFQDREGRTFEVKPRQLFFGTLDMGYRQFLELVKTKRMLWTLTGSVQVGIPLNHARRYLSAGIMTGSAVTFQFKKRYGITIATGYVAQHDNLISIRKKFYDPGYRNFMTGYRFVLAQNFDLKNAHRFSFGIEMQGAPSPLSTKTKVVAPYPNAEDIGVQTSYTPEYWTPDDPIAITNQRRAGRTMIRGSEYISLNFSYRIGKSNHAPTVTFYLQEDWSLVYDLEGASFPLFSMSNNAQDFGAGFRLLKPF